MARERIGQGRNWPGSYWPIRSRERIGPGAKRLGTNVLDRLPITEDPEGYRERVFCGMRIAESCQRVICGKFYADFFCGMKGKVRNESMRNVTEMNFY